MTSLEVGSSWESSNSEISRIATSLELGKQPSLQAAAEGRAIVRWVGLMVWKFRHFHHGLIILRGQVIRKYQITNDNIFNVDEKACLMRFATP